MRPHSLRTRLLAVTVLTLVLGLGGLLAAGNLLLASTVASDNHQRLSARIDAQLAALSLHGGRVSVRDTLDDASLDAYGWIYVHRRLIEHPTGSTASLDAAAARLAGIGSGGSPGSLRTGAFLLGRQVVRAGTGATTVATVVAAVDVGQLEALRREVLWASLALGLLIVAGATLVSYRVLSAALDPVEQMTRDADDWEAHDLERRFDLGPPRDEITALAATLDHLLDRIAASRRHEQRFASEVAHELRTPLAAIRGTAELALGEDGDSAQLALSDVVAHSQRIAATLDALIAFARRDVSPSASGVDLGAVAASFDAVSLLAPQGPVPPVEGDPGLIRQVLAPLIDNAQRHAISGVTLELTARRGAVIATVRDDGPGVDPELGARVFLPGVRGAGEAGDGAGLGLPLAQRLARSCGGEIHLGDGPGGCFVVVLPTAGSPAAQAL